MSKRLTLYHRTCDADAILATGFRDGEGSYGTGTPRWGVWISDVPLDVNEGALKATIFSSRRF